MSTNINQNLITYQYIQNIIDFYSQHIELNKKFTLTSKTLKTDFNDITDYLTQWAHIEIDDFVLLLNIINKNGIIKYTQQQDLFHSGFINDDFVASVKLKFFSAEYIKKEFKGLTIYYNIYQTIFGKALIASISDYICFLHFCETDVETTEVLKKMFKNAMIIKKSKNIHLEAIQKINNPENNMPIHVIVNATLFQEKIWNELVKLPYKSIFTYNEIANKIGIEKANRAVGTAIGKNPIAILIPCHRIIRTSGKIGEYMWGKNRKKALLIYEFLNKKLESKT